MSKKKKKHKSSVKQKHVAYIMNRINDVLADTRFRAVGYDNTDTFLHVIIDKKYDWEN